MKTGLANIFAVKEPVRKVATVVSRISRYSYKVSDGSGRITIVMSSENYVPGTEVLIENNRISGTALSSTTRQYVG